MHLPRRKFIKSIIAFLRLEKIDEKRHEKLNLNKKQLLNEGFYRPVFFSGRSGLLFDLAFEVGRDIKANNTPHNLR